MKDILNRLSNHESLSKQEAKKILIEISEEKYNPSQVASFITVFRMRNITVAELSGFREALLELCIPVDLGDRKTLDVCGTGGDGKNTFNISTLSAFVIAGAGYQVCKHGNYGVSSGCGSSNVLEHLGYKFTNDLGQLTQQIDETNICILHAPLFHPALKSVGPIRKALGVKTFFNILGPLVNPARPSHQMTGVFNLNVARLYSFVLEETQQSYAIVHGLSGFDEISLTDETKVISSNQGEYKLKASDLGLPSYNLADISGGNTVPEAAEIFINVLNNKSTPAQRDVVLANSALAIDCMKTDSNIEASLDEARESLESAAALEAFTKAVALSQ